jgi:hypothetical protein
MIEWFSNLPGLVKVILITLLAIGYLYGQIEAARGMMRVFARRARAKKVAEWQDTTRAALAQVGYGATATFADDNVVMLVPAFGDDGQPEAYVVMHKVLTALGRDHTVRSEVVPTTDLTTARDRHTVLAKSWLADGARVDGAELMK